MSGMPKMPFLLLGGGAAVVGMKIRKTQKEAPIAEAKAAKTEAAKDSLENLLRLEPQAIDVGLGLIGMVEGAQESPLLRRISTIRKQLATDLGYLLPPVRVAYNLGLRSRQYVISLMGVEISRHEPPQGRELAPHGRARSGPPTIPR
jgi:flagellar biosynthesis protein FlhA